MSGFPVRKLDADKAQSSVELDGRRRFDGFQHVDDWVPLRIVTATGPNPLPR
jgi:hypothetical protein